MVAARLPYRLMVAATLMALSACADVTRPEEVADPFEADNREVFEANAAVFRALSPGDGGGGGGPKVPVAVSQTLGNLAQNLETPKIALNDLLQGDVESATKNVFRFVINSTLGIAGIFDPATSFGLAPNDNDFGHTLYVWGVEPGAYLVLPVLGPSTERDLAGKVVDAVINPLGFVLPDNEAWTARGIRLADTAVDNLRFGDAVRDVLDESADPYLTARSVYLQNRRFELTGGAAEDDYFDPYEELDGN
jgi:phospholipid-binding lipoprotein MlaA